MLLKFHVPTLLTNVEPDNEIAQKESFFAAPDVEAIAR
jgi:hypothetical protein